MHKVSVVKCNSYDNKEVSKAIKQSIKNINFKFKKSMKILIKPNILAPQPPEKAVTTHPVIIEELCKILKQYNAKIYIGESSGNETKKAFEVSGISRLKKYAEIVNFETVDKEIVDFKTLKKVPLPKILKEVDLIIDVAKLKTHASTGVTLCVKNLYGCIPGRLKSYYHKILRLPKIFAQFLLELHDNIKPQLNIIDGVIGLEGMGPGTLGKPIKSNLIIAGTNAIATDIIASKIMGFDPDSINTNHLSKMKKEDIQIIGDKDIKLNFEKPYFTSLAPLAIFLNNLFPKPKIKFNHEKCIKCSLCAKNCPVNAITLNPYPAYSDKKCIKCCCCIEMCPHESVSLEEHFTKRFLKKMLKR
jgi:uncharacterized protein (DUF362 family)/NAD-dependent dihydropyrimidine dehydrogenase PreA subunit